MVFFTQKLLPTQFLGLFLFLLQQIITGLVSWIKVGPDQKAFGKIIKSVTVNHKNI